MCKKCTSVIIYLVFLATFIVQNIAFACTLIMGSRSNERLPLIAKQADNSGLYQNLFKLAAEKIGCELNIVRNSKKRGDFYIYNKFSLECDLKKNKITNFKIHPVSLRESSIAYKLKQAFKDLQKTG